MTEEKIKRRHLDLFSGIGGFALATEMVWENVEHVFCDNDPFSQAILKKHWPNSPIYGDIKELNGSEILEGGAVDLLTGGFPCHPSAPLESERARTTTAISGLRCFASSERLPLAGSSARTLVAYLLGTTAWFSIWCALTWRVKVTKSGRSLFQLYPSTLRTRGTGSGLLLTPTVSNIEPKDKEARYERRTAYLALTGRHFIPGSLAEQIGLLPTPRVSDSEGGEVKNVELRNGSFSRINSKGVRFGVKRKDAIGAIGMRLQPNFAEYMMGYPKDWTEITDSKLLEMRSSRKSQPK